LRGRIAQRASLRVRLELAGCQLASLYPSLSFRVTIDSSDVHTHKSDDGRCLPAPSNRETGTYRARTPSGRPAMHQVGQKHSYGCSERSPSSESPPWVT